MPHSDKASPPTRPRCRQGRPMEHKIFAEPAGPPVRSFRPVAATPEGWARWKNGNVPFSDAGRLSEINEERPPACDSPRYRGAATVPKNKNDGGGRRDATRSQTCPGTCAQGGKALDAWTGYPGRYAGIAMHDRQDDGSPPAARPRAPPARCRLRPSGRDAGTGRLDRSPQGHRDGHCAPRAAASRRGRAAPPPPAPPSPAPPSPAPPSPAPPSPAPRLPAPGFDTARGPAHSPPEPPPAGPAVSVKTLELQSK
jgi:hypothetical protein